MTPNNRKSSSSFWKVFLICILIVFGVCVVIAGGVVWYARYQARAFVLEHTSATPAELPSVQLSESARQSLQTRLRVALSGGASDSQGAITLSEPELNAALSFLPSLFPLIESRLNVVLDDLERASLVHVLTLAPEYVYLRPTDDAVVAMFNVPLRDLAPLSLLGIAKQRFLTGEAEITFVPARNHSDVSARLVTLSGETVADTTRDSLERFFEGFGKGFRNKADTEAVQAFQNIVNALPYVYVRQGSVTISGEPLR